MAFVVAFVADVLVMYFVLHVVYWGHAYGQPPRCVWCGRDFTEARAQQKEEA